MTYRQAIRAAKDACKEVMAAEGADRLVSYRLKAGELIRAAYAAGKIEGKKKVEIAEDLGYGGSWLRELVSADTPEKVVKAKTDATKRVRKSRTTRRKSAVTVTAVETDPDNVGVEEAFDTEAAAERPENYTTAFGIRLDQTMQFCRDAEFLTAGIIKYAKNPDAKRIEIAKQCCDVAEVWSELARKIKESSYGKEAA